MTAMDRTPSGDHQLEFACPSRVTAFIDGEFRPAGDGRVLPVIYPATEEQVSELEEAGADHVDRAVRAARAAFAHGPWRGMEIAQRQVILRGVALLIRQNARELAWLECLNSGIPMRHLANGQIPRAADEAERNHSHPCMRWRR